MKKLFVLIPLFAILLSGCNGITIHLGGDFVDGSGVSATETRPLDDFTRVDLQGVGDLEIVYGDDYSIDVTADDNIVPHLTTEIVGDTLEISSEPGFSFNNHVQIEYVLTVPSLEGITLSGSGNIEAPKLDANQFEITITGSGDIRINELNASDLETKLVGSGSVDIAGGTVNSCTVQISGSGDYTAGDVQASDGEATISGSGAIVLWATDDLNAFISGSGDIRYYGNPHVDSQISGSGDVESLGDK